MKKPSAIAACILLLASSIPAFADVSGAPSIFPASPSASPVAAARPAPLKDLSVRRAAAEAGSGEGVLACNSDPAGANVFIDGVSLGEAPLRKEHIKTGTYSVAFRKRGYENSVERITIKKGVTLTIDEKLAPARGSITVQSHPQGAAVYLDGVEDGITPVTLSHVSGGAHRLALLKEYFEPDEIRETLKAGESRTVRIRLERRILFLPIGAVNVPPSAAQDVLAALEGIEGLHVIPASIGKLQDILRSRELDPSSVNFLESGKKRLSLEDLAVLSSLLEEERAQFAVSVSERQAGGENIVSLALYSACSYIPDVLDIPFGDENGLASGLKKFASQWEAQDTSAGGKPFESEAAPEDKGYLFNLALARIPEKLHPGCGELITLGNAYFRTGDYADALKAYQKAASSARIGICRGTALYRMGKVYEKMGLWTDAASSYRGLCILYPDATLISPSGPKAAPLAEARMKDLYRLGILKERWWPGGE